MFGSSILVMVPVNAMQKLKEMMDLVTFRAPLFIHGYRDDPYVLIITNERIELPSLLRKYKNQ